MLNFPVCVPFLTMLSVFMFGNVLLDMFREDLAAIVIFRGSQPPVLPINKCFPNSGDILDL